MNNKLLIAALFSRGTVTDVKPFIIKITSTKYPMISTLEEPAVQDAVLNYVASSDRSLENPTEYFKASPRTVKEFNDAIYGYGFFEYGEEAIGTSEYKLRLHYSARSQYIDVNAVSIIGPDEKILYCQKCKYGPSVANTDIDCISVICWEKFVKLYYSSFARRGWVPLRTVCRIFNSHNWKLDGPRNALASIANLEIKPPERGCHVIGSNSRYKTARIVTDAHMYIAELLISTDASLRSIITVKDIYAKKGYSRRYVSFPNVTFRNFDDIYEFIKKEVDPIVTNRYHF